MLLIRHASLCSLLILSHVMTFEVTTLKTDIKKEVTYKSFKGLKNSNFVVTNLNIQRKNERGIQAKEKNATVSANLRNRGSRYRHGNIRLHNQHSQTTNMTRKIIPIVDKDNKFTRGKRKANIRRCHGLCNRSLCQWSNSLDFDKNRTPRFIPKAECSGQCSLHFVNVVSPSFLNVYTGCEPIKRDIPVFKNNKYVYLKNWPVACACTIKNLQGTRNEHLMNIGKRRRLQGKSKNKSDILKYFEIRKRILKPFLFLPQF